MSVIFSLSPPLLNCQPLMVPAIERFLTPDDAYVWVTSA